MQTFRWIVFAHQHPLSNFNNVYSSQNSAFKTLRILNLLKLSLSDRHSANLSPILRLYEDWNWKRRKKQELTKTIFIVAQNGNSSTVQVVFFPYFGLLLTQCWPCRPMNQLTQLKPATCNNHVGDYHMICLKTVAYQLAFEWGGKPAAVASP